MRAKSYILSCAAGLLASLAWVESSTGLLIIIAFAIYIYLFFKAAESHQHPSAIFTETLAGFLLFNILTFSWLHKGSIPGAILAIMINAFMMSLVFWISTLVYKRTSRFTGMVTLVAFWLGYEHLTMVVPYFSPWLNPGNVFGHDPALVQWYEYTGAAGGSLWILLTAIFSVLAYNMFRSERKLINMFTVITLCCLFIPILFSLVRYNTYENRGEETEVLIIQPNIDPFTEKFGDIPFIDQLGKMTRMAAGEISPETDWILFPETAVDDPFYENIAENNKYFTLLNSFLFDYPGTSIITGVTTIKTFPEKPDYIGNAALKTQTGDLWYEIYNSAMAVHTGEKPLFYHKSKLVPGIEKRVSILPGVVDKLVPQLGGTISGFGIQSYREIMENPKSSTRIAPIICYESVFGKFVSDFVTEGAQLLFIITNDGWWENTAGYKQHLGFASLRAIENRRSVARAANTGISCIIDQKGKIVERSEWWTETTLRSEIMKNDQLTFYTIHGDYIYRYADIFSLFIIILTFIGAPLKNLRSR